MAINRPLSTEQWRWEQYPLALRLYAGGQVYANPAVMALLDGMGRPTQYLVWDEREDEGWVALHWVVKGATGAAKVRRKGQSATWSAGAVLAYHRGLRVKKGEVRPLPVCIRDGLFLVDLRIWEVEATE